MTTSPDSVPDRSAREMSRQLAAASRVIRAAPLHRGLVKAASIDVLSSPAQGPPQPHPDAEAVLQACGRLHPGCLEFTDDQMAAAYIEVLDDRLCPVRVLERFAREQPDVADAVLGAIAAAVPAANSAERLLIWDELRRMDGAAPDAPPDAYRAKKAWCKVCTAQRRISRRGAHTRHSHDHELRRRAIESLASELYLDAERLEKLPLEAFDSASGTLTLSSAPNSAPRPLRESLPGARRDRAASVRRTAPA